jgi:hypothetical protein
VLATAVDVWPPYGVDEYGVIAAATPLTPAPASAAAVLYAAPGAVAAMAAASDAVER